MSRAFYESQVDEPKRIVPHYKLVPNMWNVYLWVDDVEAKYVELKDRGATIDYELGVKEYGVKEFGVQDLDACDIAFGQDLEDSCRALEHGPQSLEVFAVECWTVR